ncbi:MAG: S-layer homology domain-containing protein [Acidimicrobiales bacterium]|nr:S-layer homology domain-containing protein [Acidimicrobiales bacterium]
MNASTAPTGLRPVRVTITYLAAALLAASGALAPVPAAAQVAGPAAPRVAFFGDSIGYNARTELRDAITPLYPFAYHAENAADVADWTDDIAALARSTSRPHTLLVELGTADAGWDHSTATFEADVRALLDVASPRIACIRWFDLRAEPSLYRYVNAHAVAFNRVLWRVAADYPNVEIVHYAYWATLAHDGPYWHPDGLHHSPAGRRQFARLARQAAIGCDPARTTGPFWDVPDGLPAATAINWMAANGISYGHPTNRTFRAVVGTLLPPVTRAQAATYLWRLAGRPTGSPPNPWPDAPARKAAAFDWAAATNILTPAPDGAIHPTQPLTRGELATALWRLAGSPTGLAPHPWTDAPPELDDALNWAHQTGIITGYADGTFRPTRNITRAQNAKALHAYHQATTPPPAPAASQPAPTTTTTTATAPTTTAPTTTAPTTTAPTTPPTTTAPITPPTTAPTPLPTTAAAPTTA